MGKEHDFDVVIVGSGFGGSVTALRLVEKGYRVGIVEAGRRFTDEDFAKHGWDVRKFVWAPKLGMFGIQRIHLLRNVMIFAGAGVGGGSLNYANTLYTPPEPFFQDPQWANITDWRAELSAHYDQATRMLGVVKNPTITPADEVMQKIAADMGIGETFTQTPVGVFFGTDGKAPGETVPDPFFGGVGPQRTGCTECGECMTGCRVGAKNTLVKNYLGLAERAGAQVIERTTVTNVEQRGDGSWLVSTEVTGAHLRKNRRGITAGAVVMAAGTWGTQNLMHKLRDKGSLPNLSPRLGELTRTNSEAILGVSKRHYDPAQDLSSGVAITSSIHPSSDTHIEPVRYGKGANAIAMLQSLLVDGVGRGPRWLRGIAELVRNWRDGILLVDQRKWGQRTMIILVMQSLNNSITTYTKRSIFGRRSLSSRQGHGEPNPTWIPIGHRVAERVAAVVDGIAGGTIADLFNIPSTAHFLGGCAIGETPEEGVIDPYHRVHGYPSLYVVDGSAVSANLGVNPSLTISAQAERAAALWPNKGAVDQRPAQGEPYRRLDPIAPEYPVVPAHAPGALRQLPIVTVQKELA